MRRLLFIIAMLSCSMLGRAQGNVLLLTFPGAPSGTCNFYQLGYNTATGAISPCTTGGTWGTPFGSGGGGGISSITFNAPLTGGTITTSGTVGVTCSAGQVLGGATPACTATPTLGASGTLGSLTMGNATSGTLTVEPTTGSITSYTIGLPVAQPTAGNTFLSCTAANPAVCTWGAGGVSSFTGDGTLISNSGSTGAVTATIATAGARTVWGNATSATAAPGYTASPSVTSLTVQNQASEGAAAYNFGAPSATSGAARLTPSVTYTVTGTATTANFQENYFGSPTFTDGSAGTITDAFNTYMGAPAAAGGSLTITRSHTLGLVDSTSAASSITGGLVVSATLGTTATSVGIGGGNVNAGGTVTGALLATATHCAAAGSGANPSIAACSAAPAGFFSCATNASTGTCQVNTTAVTANSTILVQPDSTLGTALSVPCNTTADTGLTAPRVSSRSAANSFTITLGTFATNPLCFSYAIIN